MVEETSRWNTDETIFDNALTSADFLKEFSIQIDIEGYYVQLYKSVKLNIFQGCIMAFFEKKLGNEE